MKKRFRSLAFLLAAIPVLGTLADISGKVCAVVQQKAGYQLELHTPAEIRQFYQAHPFDFSRKDTYATNPVQTAPYAPGALSQAAQTNALNLLNVIRYAAGLPADVMLDSACMERAQAAALVNAANGVMTHFPDKPAGMSESLYQLGYEGASHSNLMQSTRDIPSAAYTVPVYLSDTDPYNTVLGHRRWVLNPDMQYTGFGLVGQFSAMYAHDQSREAAFAGDYIAWPAVNTPYELYDRWDYGGFAYAFSVTLGYGFDAAREDRVQVTMRSQKTGKSWTFNKNNENLIIDQGYYGMPNCIIFNPGFMFGADDAVSVSVTGITKEGKAADISYTVRFFSLDGTAETVFGDQNGDGRIQLDDVTELLWLYNLEMIGASQAGTAEIMRADVNGSGGVDLNDVICILEYYTITELLGGTASWREITGNPNAPA